jgi:flagellar operon protein
MEINGGKMIQRIGMEPKIPINPIEPNLAQPNNLEKLRQNSFIDILRDKMQPSEISFSAHALSRLEERNIIVDGQIKAKLENAINQIAQKGGKESLIMLDDIAYVVSVPNKTVITALETSNSNVFTNIDSALVVRD